MYLGEYWSRHYAKIPALIRNGLIAPLVQAFPDARDKPSLEIIRRIKKFLRGMSLAFPERFCGWREIFPFSLRRQLLKNPEQDNFYLDLIRDTARNQMGRFPGDPINLMLYMDLKGLLPGDMFPSERDLCDRFGVGRNTVRNAFTNLQAMGLLDHTRGRRPRVAAPTLSRAMASVGDVVTQILETHTIANYDLYMTLPHALIDEIRQLVLACGVAGERLRIDSV